MRGLTVGRLNESVQEAELPGAGAMAELLRKVSRLRSLPAHIR